MNIPNIKHPKRYAWRGMLFEVISFDKLTDQQAELIAANFVRTHKFTAKQRGTLIRVIYTGDQGD